MSIEPKLVELGHSSIHIEERVFASWLDSARAKELQAVIKYIDSIPGEEISKAGVIHWLQEAYHREA